MKRHIMAFLAHPDDETFIFGGTIAHYTKRGHRFTIVSATKGEMGRRMGNPPTITRESMPIVREEELREACRILGADEPIFLGLRDKTVEYANRDALIGRLVELLSTHLPDALLTFHPQWGGHPDHCAIGEAATSAASRFPDMPLYYIMFGNPLKSGYGLSKQDVVKIDVSDSLMEKLHAYRAHRSQMELEEWPWRPDREAVLRFSSHEYFMIADRLPRVKRDDLFLATN